MGGKGPRGPAGAGFKLTSDGNFDLENKKLTNVADATSSNEAVTKSQLDVKPDSTSALLLNGQNHMTGDLDLRGNKLILPEEINMNRKLIKNLDADESDDLSAVNMATLKKLSSSSSGDIDLQDKFNVKSSKQQNFSHLAQITITMCPMMTSRTSFFPGKKLLQWKQVLTWEIKRFSM